MAQVRSSEHCKHIAVAVEPPCTPLLPSQFTDPSRMQITLCGFVLVIFNFATMLYYDPTYLTQKGGATGPPQWIYFT